MPAAATHLGTLRALGHDPDRARHRRRYPRNMADVAEVEFVFEPQEEGGYHVYAPDLPGLHTQGDTLDEATENAREALSLNVEGLREEGRTLDTGIVRRKPRLCSSARIATVAVWRLNRCTHFVRVCLDAVGGITLTCGGSLEAFVPPRRDVDAVCGQADAGGVAGSGCREGAVRRARRYPMGAGSACRRANAADSSPDHGQSFASRSMVRRACRAIRPAWCSSR